MTTPPGLARLRRFAARSLEVARETGPRGVLRRSLRVALDRASDDLFGLERRLRRVSLAADLEAPARRELQRTRSLDGRERGRAAYVLGPAARSEAALLGSLPKGALTIRAWDASPLADAPAPRYLVAPRPPTSRGAVDEALGRFPEATWLLPLSALPDLPGACERRFYGASTHASELWGVDLDPAHFPAHSDDLQLGLALAIWLGCSPIYLVGAAYDGLARPDGGAFTATGALRGTRPACLAFPGPTPYSEAARRCSRLIEGYRYLRAEAERRGLEVRTVGEASFLDVFPRISATSARP